MPAGWNARPSACGARRLSQNEGENPRGIGLGRFLLAHALLLVLVLPDGGASAGDGLRIMEVGLVEMPGAVPRNAPAIGPGAGRHGQAGGNAAA